MKFRSHVRSRAAKRVFAVVAAAMVMLGITAVPAFAHTAEISGVADCSGKVTFTVTAWPGTTEKSRTNTDIEVGYWVNGKQLPAFTKGEFNAGNGFSFTGSVTPDSLPVQIWAKPATNWADGHAPVAADLRVTAPIKAPTNCTTSAPKASIKHDCSTYAVTLDNSGSNVPVTYTVAVTGAASREVTVPGGATQTVDGKVTEDSTYTITVTAGGAQLASETFTVDCTSNDTVQPTATVSVTCEGYSAVLDNSKSTVPVTFTVDVTGKAAATYTVAAGAVDKTSVAGDVPPETEFTVAVAAEGKTLATKTLPDTACSVSPPVLEPKATIKHSCTKYTATLDNSGSDTEVEFLVTVNGTETRVTVPAGETKEQTGDVVEDQKYTVTVSANGDQLATSTFTVDCTVVSPPGPQTATIAHDCETYTVTLKNADDTPADFTVTVNGKDTDVTVPANDSATQSGPVAEDGTYTISVSTDDGVLVTSTFTVDCTVVSPPTVATASISHDCDGWTIRLDNSEGTEAVQYAVNIESEKGNSAGGYGFNTTVAAGDTARETGDVAEDTRYTVDVKVGDDRVARDTFLVNCTKVSPPSSGTSAGGTSSGSTTGTSALPDTGNPVSPGLVGTGIGLLFAGGLALVVGLGRRRSTSR